MGAENSMLGVQHKAKQHQVAGAGRSLSISYLLTAGADPWDLELAAGHELQTKIQGKTWGLSQNGHGGSETQPKLVMEQCMHASTR